MKNKKAIYILLPALILIWGIIIYRIINYKRNNHTNLPISDISIKEHSIDLHTATYKINMNYKDPFFKHLLVNKKKTIVHSHHPVVKKIVKLHFQWPVIYYKGMIQNNNSRNAVALIKFNGKDHLEKPKAKFYNDIVLEKIWTDSIKVSHNKDIKYIKK